ncbi:glycosyltransferase family 8 protein [Sediminibacterium sp.]|uniref:glycosyltransferase family 8 protein n=1 Tax=Sediminibacterium sp. TaxID=1917865 RepID=UPI003F72907C
MKKQLNIVVITNDHYVVLLAALIKSIEVNLINDNQLIFNIIDDKISQENKAKLTRSVNQQISSLKWVNMDGLIPDHITLPLDRTSYPLNIYMRFFIPYFIDESVEKVLYLDVDMIFQQDISLLFELDLSHHVIAAVQDSRIKTFDNNWGGIKNYKKFGFEGSAIYFNSGLMLMNLKSWRSLGITEKLIQCMNENIHYANYPDQYGLNVVLYNQWLSLDKKWNHFADLVSAGNPFVIHFVQRKPIYKSFNGVQLFREQFYHYLEMTEWKNFVAISELSRIANKTKIVINKLTKLFSHRL